MLGFLMLSIILFTFCRGNEVYSRLKHLFWHFRSSCSVCDCFTSQTVAKIIILAIGPCYALHISLNRITQGRYKAVACYRVNSYYGIIVAISFLSCKGPNDS